MPSPPYLPGGFLLFSLTTFSAASFRLLSLGFHGLCLFFFFSGGVTLMIQILQVCSA